MSIRHDHDKYSANEATAVNGRLIVTKPLVTVSILLFLLVALSNSARAQNYALRWSDEFDGPAGSAPDQTKWNYNTGGGGWGNNELETYTNRTQNAFLDGDGHLVIKAIKETFTGADGIRREYTSARLLTKGKFSQRYGRFEARIKLPFGQGIWPAFWMLGANIDQVGWPMCGEMDIMENIGREPFINHGTLHGPGYSGGSGLGGIYTLPAGQKFSDDFHIFIIEWEATAVRFYVDGNLYQTKTTADAAGKQWVFDHPFFILLNVAVGGNFPGNPNDTTTFPQTMTVDYVRVYADDRFAPKINSVAATRKDLIVSGENFDSESKIVMNGDVQKTLRDDVASGELVGKKVAKKISSEQTVKIQVQNGDNQTSPEFNFTKP
jgi:beta-glucanase (GH16 family)